MVIFASCLLVLALTPVSARADEFTIRRAYSEEVGGIYRLNAEIDYVLSAEAREALENGVPLNIKLYIDVKRQRPYVWDETVATLVQHYQLRYHALTEQYIVKNFNSGVQETYSTLRSAMRALGRIEDIPMLDAELLEPDSHYMIHLRARLDIEALPAPLRPWAWFSPNWRLSSNSYSWKLQ